MSKRLFKNDPARGMTIWWESTDDGFVLHYEQDVEPILELNKKKQSAGREYYAKDPDMWRVASIPVGIQMEWMVKHGVDVLNEEHWPAVRKLLNSSDYRYLRTAEVII
jgi:hypothetical protein